MMLDHLTPDQLARAATVFMVALLGILEIATPGCFGGIRLYFRGAQTGLGPEQRERLARVLAARTDAEGTDSYTRYAGVFTIAMAAIGLIPAVPSVLPYAASCLALAIAMLLAYLHFRRLSERRIAPLARRTAWTSMPPLVIASWAICLAGAAAFAVFPQYRIGAFAAIVSGIALCAIAWRVAIAPAMLFGDDAQLEYLVDEHVRFCRATGLVSLACAPPVVLVMLAGAALRSGPPVFAAVTWLVIVAFLVVVVVSLNPLRKRILVT
jgi:hypothetical protein